MNARVMPERCYRGVTLTEGRVMDDENRQPRVAANENGNVQSLKPSEAAPGMPLLITRMQRAQLRGLGFSEDDIRVMTPLDAHRHLAEDNAAPVPSPPSS